MKVINTNVVWNFCLCEHAARRMKEQGEGNIVFVNSNTAYRAIPDRIAYETSKGGQLGMMRGLALDLGKYNIRVNAVLPGMQRFRQDILRSVTWQTARILQMQYSILPLTQEIRRAQSLLWTGEIPFSFIRSFQKSDIKTKLKKFACQISANFFICKIKY